MVQEKMPEESGKNRKNPERNHKKLEKFAALFSKLLRYISPGIETRV